MKIIYRDSYFWAIHKPALLPTYGESAQMDSAKKQLEDKMQQRLFPVHRIDADTEGIVLFALDSKTAAGLIRLFKEHKIKKTYLAWCVGTVPESGSIRSPLKKHKPKAGSPATESARTDFTRIKVWNGFSQVRIHPYTGRFHQIRRHFSGQGHPLVGDPQYGAEAAWIHFFKPQQPHPLQLLAESLEFIHPMTRKPIHIKTKAI
jgi:tRNA pseudouridine65 synthase